MYVCVSVSLCTRERQSPRRCRRSRAKIVVFCLWRNRAISGAHVPCGTRRRGGHNAAAGADEDVYPHGLVLAGASAGGRRGYPPTNARAQRARRA